MGKSMLNLRQSRPNNTADSISREVLSVVRILIASYFLATATGLIMEPTGRNLFDIILPAAIAQPVSTGFLSVTAFAVMVGYLLRPAALALSVYLVWSALLQQNLIAGDPLALSAFWRDMALLGAVLMIALVQPGGSIWPQFRKKTIVPRRISPSTETDVVSTFRHTPVNDIQNLETTTEPQQVSASIVQFPDRNRGTAEGNLAVPMASLAELRQHLTGTAGNR